jgi:hypothetical protein
MYLHPGTQEDFMEHGRDAQAFVGWPVTLPIYIAPADSDGIRAWGNSEYELQSSWMLGEPLNVCLYIFNAELTGYGEPFTYEPHWNFYVGPFHVEGGAPNYAYSYYKIYGAVDLTSMSDMGD